MAEPRLSSVRPESRRTGTPVSGVTPGTGTGRGTGRVGSYTARTTERTPMRQVYAKELAWAEKHLPGEYGPFVALAIASVKRQGGKPSTGTVMAHLEALGRDAASRSRLAERRTNG